MISIYTMFEKNRFIISCILVFSRTKSSKIKTNAKIIDFQSKLQLSLQYVASHTMSELLMISVNPPFIYIIQILTVYFCTFWNFCQHLIYGVELSTSLLISKYWGLTIITVDFKPNMCLTKMYQIYRRIHTIIVCFFVTLYHIVILPLEQIQKRNKIGGK